MRPAVIISPTVLPVPLAVIAPEREVRLLASVSTMPMSCRSLRRGSKAVEGWVEPRAGSPRLCKWRSS